MWRKSWRIPVMLVGLMTAQAALAQVRDQGEFIQNKATANKIDQVIQDIHRRFGKDVVIETFSSVPARDLKRVEAMDPDSRKRYFFDQAVERAKSTKLNGFYIMVNKTPHGIAVVANNRTLKTFTQAKVTEAREIMASQFKNGNFDEGLLQGVDFIRTQLEANPPAAERGVVPRGAAPAAPGKKDFDVGGLICVGLVVLAVVWLVFGLIRGMSRGGMAGAGGGGGGFMTGLLGGLFGAMAGNWLYHNFFGGGSGWGSQAYGDSPGSSGDDGYGGSAGDWDGGGGGDVGGGDWGGGGGDWGGGGGGDW